jgi:hypothetical protein
VLGPLGEFGQLPLAGPDGGRPAASRSSMARWTQRISASSVAMRLATVTGW